MVKPKAKAKKKPEVVGLPAPPPKTASEIKKSKERKEKKGKKSEYKQKKVFKIDSKGMAYMADRTPSPVRVTSGKTPFEDEDIETEEKAMRRFAQMIGEAVETLTFEVLKLEKPVWNILKKKAGNKKILPAVAKRALERFVVEEIEGAVDEDSVAVADKPKVV